jgi:hypothetical protein
MRVFWKREAKSVARLVAISYQRAAQWSGLGQLTREDSSAMRWRIAVYG